jgi:poly(glycerol-phosphate) alpha-glucosyltransferase
MLSARSLDVARWKKFLAAAVFKNTVLRSAQCLQAFSEHEVGEIRAYGLRNPVCVIPNGIDLPECPPSEPPPWRGLVAPDKKVLLYLGRLHPIKGLPDLLRAWTEFQRRGDTAAKDWNIAIAGWGEGGHEAELKAQVRNASLTGSVHFLGPQFGDDKAAAYHHADAVVLPSLSEGLPTAVLEAWAHSRPVLMTPECNLPVGFETEAALRLDREPAAMADGLAQLCALSDAERAAMGARGRLLVAGRFSWRKIAAELRDVYEWMAGGGPAPACVTLN